MKVTFCVFRSLCSAGETYRLISSRYIFACTACSAIQFGTEMNLPKTYKPYKKRACLLRIDGVIRVFTFSRRKSHRVQCKLEAPFSAGRLAPIPMTVIGIGQDVLLKMGLKFTLHPMGFSAGKRKYPNNSINPQQTGALFIGFIGLREVHFCAKLYGTACSTSKDITT